MHKLTSWLSWVNRQKIVVLIGAIALGLGAVFPWYQLPPQGLEAFSVNLFWINIGRLFAAILALFGFAAVFYYGISRLPRQLFWIGLVAVLLFPYCVTTLSPTVSFLATTYSSQNDRVSAHIDRNFSEVQAQWKQSIKLNPSKPTESIFDLRITDSRFFQMPSWERVWMEGFGYNNSFFSFIGRGWGVTVTGLVISLMGGYLETEESELHNLLKDLSKLLPSIGILLGIIICSLIWANIANYNLSEKFAKGEYQAVIAGSRSLATLYPPFKGDTAFIERLGKAGLYTNQTNLSLVNFIRGLESYRLADFDKARDYFQLSLTEEPKNFIVRGYLASAVFNKGIDYFNGSNQLNSPKAGGAIDLFDQVLEIFPSHVEALYALMIARVVNGQFDKSAQIAKQIIEQNKYFQIQNNSLIGQAYLHMSWNDFASDRIPEAWHLYRQSIDDSNWRK
ncbi:tetratricopeptide repeat protein [Tumidithrix elongata RA019]|uniref:Tetratricopeptide repeat protein n=1 Tax=Tumidithrix elongata BACA0141 TaxID=2716417 RepID=A0AAW9PX73_9CYAN|nr:tetratricopeptide repeat protein [Tumidithrix elongata RA019]